MTDWTIQAIDEYQDVIDSRDVIAKIAELEADDERNEDDEQLLSDLRDLASEGADYCEDWTFGEALIRDSYFTDYAQELADDIGAIDANASWPSSHIDWDAAARELRMDYSPLTFRGVTYWAR